MTNSTNAIGANRVLCCSCESCRNGKPWAAHPSYFTITDLIGRLQKVTDEAAALQKAIAAHPEGAAMIALLRGVQ